MYWRGTTTSRNINYFYKWNIAWNSLWWGLVATGLALHLNLRPVVAEGKLGASHLWYWGADSAHANTTRFNHLKRNALLSCQQTEPLDNQTRAAWEFSLFTVACFR